MGPAMGVAIVHLVLLVAIVLASYYVIAKRLSKAPKFDFDAARAQPPRRASRVAEASILLIIGGMIWFLNAAYGRVFHVHEFNPALVNRHVIVAIVYGLGVIAIAVIALWRTTPAIILAACLLSMHGLMMNFHNPDLFKRAAPAAPQTPGTLTIMPESNIKGVDVWVNGVYIGKTPAKIPFKDLQEKLPQWNQPEETNEDLIQLPEYYASGVRWDRTSRWMRLSLRPDDFTIGRLREGGASRQNKTDYYIKMRHGEDWGYSTGGYSGAGGGDEYSMTYYMGVTFPDRIKRIDTLLDQVRLADYRPSAEWLRAFESLGDDGLLAMRNAAADEPRMMEAFDAWVDQRYGAVKDSESAWHVLEQIRREAESQKTYSSVSPAGREVERLAPRLDPHRLASICCALIRNYGSVNVTSWNVNGRPEFGYAEGGLNLGARVATSNMGLSSGHGGTLPIGDLPVVHATAILFREGKMSPAERDRIASEIVRRHHDSDSFMRLAVQLNAPSVEQFVLRQNWHEVIPQNWRDRIMFGGNVNRWLNLAARMPGDTGRGFRHKNAELNMQMADEITKHNGVDFRNSPHESDLDFLFVDDKYLANQYWPRYKEKIKYNHLENEWVYLARMDAPPQMFIGALRDAKDSSDLWEGIRILNKFLTPEKSGAIADALIGAIDKNLFDPNLGGRHGSRDDVLRQINTLHRDPRVTAREMLAKLHETGEESENLKLHVGDWLANKEPNHPLVELLARDADPNVRVLVLPVIEADPTPEHRNMLNALLSDSNTTVTAAAHETAKKLNELSLIKPASLADRAGQ